ncbi:hypothetical protein OG963_43665 (plasmid) [Streptomyces sp. NBC_01707]|uniref:hypothetical protein n=1 Tax=Streptomyces sp. NBC_01707 TaxID=2975914 RepID=UPI002F913EDF
MDPEGVAKSRCRFRESARSSNERHRPGQEAATGRLTVQADGKLAAVNESGPLEWTLDALAAEARRLAIEMGRSQVCRILLAEGVRWRHTRSWVRSRDANIDHQFDHGIPRRDWPNQFGGNRVCVGGQTSPR